MEALQLGDFAVFGIVKESAIAYKRKRASIFGTDLCRWMQEGSLHPLFAAIDRPGFMRNKDFKASLANSGLFCGIF